MRSPRRLQQAFTLIEIMVVIVIMTIMASLVVLNIGGVDQRHCHAKPEKCLFSI